MAEIVTLTSAITKPSQTTIRLERLMLDIEQKAITVQWLGTNNEAGSAVYPTPAPADHPSQPTGATLLNSLNNANLSTKSLVKRVLERLQTDGYLPAGTISGTPD
jgi:hypothetical protein